MKTFAIIAGAGISVDYPSNLPSWWKFNEAIVRVIKKNFVFYWPGMSTEIDSISFDESFPVHVLSDVIVRNGLGRFYFALLKILNSSQPNANHMALADLVKCGCVSTIVTTNFDTLLETAFAEKKISLHVLYRDCDFDEKNINGNVLLKIHGSVDDDDSFIDTVTQKSKGLSERKRICLEKKLDCDIVFVGFSGTDFDFGEDYIPIKKTLERGHAVRWIVFPGSKVPEIALILKDKFPAQMKIEEKTLSSFFKEFGILYKVFEKDAVIKKEYDLEGYVEKYFSKMGLGAYSYMGFCLHFLWNLGKKEQCQSVVEQFEKFIRVKTQFPYDACSGINALACMQMNFNQFEKAIRNFLLVASINQRMQKMRENIPVFDSRLDEEANEENRTIYMYAFLNVAWAYYGMNDLVMVQWYLNMAKKYMNKNNSLECDRIRLLECKIENKNYEDEMVKIANALKKNGDLELSSKFLLEQADSYIKMNEMDKAFECISQLERIMKNVFSNELSIYFDVVRWSFYAQKNIIFKSKYYLKIVLKKILKNKSKVMAAMVLQRAYIYGVPGISNLNDFVELKKLVGDENDIHIIARNGIFSLHNDGSADRLKRFFSTHDFGL